MEADPWSASSTATVAGLVVASLGAALAYTQLGSFFQNDSTKDDGDDDDDDKDTHIDTRSNGAKSTSGARKGKRRRKGKGEDVGGGLLDEPQNSNEAERERNVEDKGKGKEIDVQNVPGDFDAAGPPAGTVASVSRSRNGKTKQRKKKKNQDKADDVQDVDGRNVQADEDVEETDKDVSVGRGLDLRSGDSTDADAPAAPSSTSIPGASTSAGSRVAGRGSLRASTRFAQSAQQHTETRAIRPSLSFDTDSSWTHVDHRRLKSSKSLDGQTKRFDATSSDLASTESNSPVAERADGVDDIRGPRTLAEKLVPRPEETGVEDMLERSDYPALARVMRVQPRAGESPAPGFSWEDYGDVVEDSLLIHDADQEDEGEWGIVKSRSRTRSSQTMTTTPPVAKTSETMTKKQRQNARKRELSKAAKAETEAARLQGLAKHKRELERIRIMEQTRQGGTKSVSGGMQAVVDDQGKLVWE